jgi:hypothetical protein
MGLTPSVPDSLGIRNDLLPRKKHREKCHDYQQQSQAKLWSEFHFGSPRGGQGLV